MKRLLLITFSLLLFCTACAKDGTREKIHAGLTPPLEFDCSFILGELDGRAHVKLDENSVAFGITDGALKGLVAHATAEGTRLTYEGIDVSFSPKTTEKFTRIQKLFAFLREQDYNPNTATLVPAGETYTFTDEDATVELTVNPETKEFVKLHLKQGDEVLTLTIE